jgi:hypothetical protein
MPATVAGIVSVERGGGAWPSTAGARRAVRLLYAVQLPQDRVSSGEPVLSKIGRGRHVPVLMPRVLGSLMLSRVGGAAAPLLDRRGVQRRAEG